MERKYLRLLDILRVDFPMNSVYGEVCGISADILYCRDCTAKSMTVLISESNPRELSGLAKEWALSYLQGTSKSCLLRSFC